MCGPCAARVRFYRVLLALLVVASAAILSACSGLKGPARPAVAAPVAAATSRALTAVARLQPPAGGSGSGSDQITPTSGTASAEDAAGGTPQPLATPSNRVSVLLLGIDCRPDELVCRSDAMMVLTLDEDTGTAGMLSLSRDLLVPIPGTPPAAAANAGGTLDDPAGVGILAPYRGSKAKLNTANFFGDLNHFPGGGPELARQTVSNFLGQPIDYWIRVNFNGFRYMVDQLGGIDIDVPTAINDPEFPDEGNGYAPLYIPAGHIHMDGQLALDYARTRHQDSDYQRARRQQQVVLAVKEKLLQPGELASLLPRLPGIAMTLAQSVQTNMPIATAATLARQLAELDLKDVTQVVIDDTMGRDGNDATWGFVLIPDMTRVRAATARAFADHPMLAEAPLGSPTPTTIQDEAARVAILNGTAQKDLPNLVAMSLAGTGFHIVGVGSVGSETYAQTWLITHGTGWPATQAWLINRFGIVPDHVRSDQPDGIADLVLVLGNDTAQASQVQ